MSITSFNGQGTGHRLEIHAGKVVSKSPAPAILGTTLEIRDLFYNTPARLKFLKSDSYERACLLKVVEESALANVTVGYQVRVNGREVYNLPAQTGEFSDAVIARARAILGDEVADSFLYRCVEGMGLHLFITPVDKLVSVRDMQYVFVNRRPIDSKAIGQAIYKAYQNARPKDRHPAFLVYLTLNPSEFDVNIHPQKREVRFVNEHHVFGFMMHQAGEAIFAASRPVEVAVTAPLPPKIDLPKPAAVQLFTAVSSQPEREKNYPTLATANLKPKPITPLSETEEPVPYSAGPVPSAPVTETPAAPSAPEGATASPAWFEGPYHYLGQLQRSYLLFENPQGLIVIDQHAAQERVLFEHYLEAFDNRKVTVQKLLFPLHVDLPPSNAQTLLSWADFLKTAGFELESFSARTVLVHTRPHMIRFKEDDLKEFIVSLAQLVGDPTKSTETLKRRMVAMLACKKAIKAHDQISPAEAEALLDSMQKCKDGMHCPHGRPCVAQLKMKDIDKLFGR